MSAKSLLQKIKDVFGLRTGSTESQDGGDVDVTIEREPGSGDAAAPPESDGETAVESTETHEPTTDDNVTEPSTDEDTPGTSAEDSPSGSSTDESSSESSADDSTSESATSDEPVEAIKGIGPTYSDRLAGVGIETVAQLAEADPETVAEAAQTGETKAGNWIDRARNRQS